MSGEQSAESGLPLTDSEWEWIEPMLRAGKNSSAAKDALRGYLNDRIAERIVRAREEAWERGNNDGLTFAAAPQKSLLTNPYRVDSPALGTPQNPVNGATHPCPTPGYAGHHTAVGAGAISSPYVCHGCGTWFVLPDAGTESTRPLPPEASDR